MWRFRGPGSFHIPALASLGVLKSSAASFSLHLAKGDHGGSLERILLVWPGSEASHFCHFPLSKTQSYDHI